MLASPMAIGRRFQRPSTDLEGVETAPDGGHGHLKVPPPPPPPPSPLPFSLPIPCSCIFSFCLRRAATGVADTAVKLAVW